MSLEQLSRSAELNFCEKCFRVYKALIEPSIKLMLFKPMAQWREVESYVTQMLAKAMGVVKGDLGIISLGEFVDKRTDEELANRFDVDPKAFRKIEKWGFKSTVKYLKDKGVPQKHSHSFLYMISDIRNRIHTAFDEFSEKDLEVFRLADALEFQVRHNTMWVRNIPEEAVIRTRASIEAVAQSLCKQHGFVDMTDT